MRRVPCKNTKPELVVRKLVYSLGYRYRLRPKELPGRPDLSFPGRKKIIFVNGCFWHYHGCEKGKPPKSNLEYWLPKLERNRDRDRANLRSLESAGWKVLVLWQCELGDNEALTLRIREFLQE